MAPLVVTDTNEKYEAIQAIFNVLYCELEKGIQSMNNGEVYTIDEAWEEIDKI